MSETNKKTRRKKTESPRLLSFGLGVALYSEEITVDAHSGTHVLRGGPEDQDPLGVTAYVEGGALLSALLKDRTVHYNLSPRGGPKVVFLYWFQA